MKYYEENADAFIENTLDVDMSELYAKFFDAFSGKSILDVGCGPGRDVKYFKSKGYTVEGVEPCEKLSLFAEDYSGAKITKSKIQDFQSTHKYDGIWACASLLHLDDSQLELAFSKLASMLDASGALYCSFKYGSFQGERNGRFFNDKTLESIKPHIEGHLKVESSWISEDKRPDRNEEWLNLILKLD